MRDFCTPEHCLRAGQGGPVGWSLDLTSSLHRDIPWLRLPAGGLLLWQAALVDGQRLPHIDLKFLPKDFYYNVI